MRSSQKAKVNSRGNTWVNAYCWICEVFSMCLEGKWILSTVKTHFFYQLFFLFLIKFSKCFKICSIFKVGFEFNIGYTTTLKLVEKIYHLFEFHKVLRISFRSYAHREYSVYQKIDGENLNGSSYYMREFILIWMNDKKKNHNEEKPTIFM